MRLQVLALLTLGAISLAAPYAVSAQARVEVGPYQTALDRQLQRPALIHTPMRLVLGASLGAAVGWLGGGYLGYQLDKNSGGEDPGLVGMVYGTVSGSAVGAPLGARLAAPPGAVFGKSLLGSLIGSMGAVGIGAASGEPLVGWALAPLLQVIGAVMPLD